MDHLNGRESPVIFYFFRYRRAIKSRKETSQLRPRGTDSTTCNQRSRLCHIFPSNWKVKTERKVGDEFNFFERSPIMQRSTRCARGFCIFSHSNVPMHFIMHTSVCKQWELTFQLDSSHNFGDDHKVAVKLAIEFVGFMTIIKCATMLILAGAFSY